MTASNSQPPIHLGAPGEDIHIRDIQAIKQRFKHLHQMREQRVQEFLQPRQQVFLDLLPLLFHYNHPLLPGFISSETPSGIPDYSPDNRALRAAKQFSKKLAYGPRAIPSFCIEAIYLMGSVGSIAFSKTSDIDIWLCYRPNLADNLLDELRQKAQSIEQWAIKLNLEVHFFLMDNEQFRLGQTTPISTESSGETQHYLLLEEFYRTSVYIAGKSPAWWFVPPHQEHRYAEYVRHLQDNRFVQEHELIDFGGLDNIPAEEFTSATLWHIYKSIGSPHKSLLKLFLMECYASEYPNTQWLAQTIKRAIYDGSYLGADLDAYFLIYQKIESYLSHAGSSERLALVRKCFYLKTMDTSDKQSDNDSHLFKLNYLQDIAIQHQWPSDTLTELQQQKLGDVQKAVAENTVILKQLGHCYRMIKSFANAHIHEPKKDNDDLKLISRKLNSFLEKKPGKIEYLTTRATIKKPQELSVVEIDPNRWCLFLGKANLTGTPDLEPIKSFRSLPELLAWSVGNSLYSSHLQLYFSARSVKLGEDTLHNLLTRLNTFLTTNLPDSHSLTAYQQHTEPLATLLIINLGSISNDVKDDGSHIISERSDVFSYGTHRLCFIQSIDRLSISTWGEITCLAYQGINGLFSCLIELFNSHRKPLSVDDLTIVCHTPARAEGIIRRIQSVFGLLLKIFAKTPENRLPRFILPAESSYYVFQHHNGLLGYQYLSTEIDLMHELKSTQRQFSAVFFDQNVLSQSPIPLLYAFNKALSIQVFYQELKNAVQVYVIDEKGSLFSQQHQKTEIKQLLNQYSTFLLNVLNRNLNETKLTLEYYEIIKNSAGVLSCNPVILHNATFRQELELRIFAEIINDSLVYTIYSNEHEFSSLDYGNHVFQAVYDHVVQFRQSKQKYPVHITDIDLPLAAFHLDKQRDLQSIHYLDFKQKIEGLLNR
ncbi:MAG: class I adenylate cyclase [Methylococcaceae bacterium]